MCGPKYPDASSSASNAVTTAPQGSQYLSTIDSGVEKNILIVLPFSGRKFGGGLAILNQQLTKALACMHDVKLLTIIPIAAEDHHGRAGSVYIQMDEGKTEEVTKMGIPGSGSPEHGIARERLYELINDETVLSEKVLKQITGLDGWKPDIIIGHSRFSGPAAVLLKKKYFKNAKTQYFLHSFPFEGSILSGYEAYDDNTRDVKLAEEKLQKEMFWMPQADIVMAMGPIMRAGATLILKKAKKENMRIHECIPGAEPKKKPVKYNAKVPVKLMFSGRASAPIKGFEDILLAMKDLGGAQTLTIDIYYWDDMKYKSVPPSSNLESRTVNTAAVQEWVDVLLLPEAWEREEVKRKLQITQRKLQITQRELCETQRKVREEPTSNKYTVAEANFTEAIAQFKKNIAQFKKNIADKNQNIPGTRWATVHDKISAIKEEICKYHAVLMPSYIEHFGLVPFDALEQGIPVLVNEISGAGMFLKRCGPPGVRCVVEDFDIKNRRLKNPHDTVLPPLKPEDFLTNVAAGAFDDRPVEWAKAIESLKINLKERFEDAGILHGILKDYTYHDFATTVVLATDDNWNGQITVQGRQGQVSVYLPQ